VIQGTLQDEDWYDLTHEQPNTFYEILLGPDCFAGPRASEYTWFPGQLTVDGETVDEVGFRKKGFIGSMSWTRPSLKVDSDRFVMGQELSDGAEHFTLNNNNQDPSRLHSCLSYAVFRKAGVPAPLCSFATVEINGSDLGVYSNVEPIKNKFLRDNFGTDDGDLFEGTVSDFNDEWIVTFEVKTDGSTLGPLEELSDILEGSDDALIPKLESALDLDGFITEWAVETLIGHWDGYAGNRNNFYVYHDSADGLLKFIPWGADSAFEDPEGPALTPYSTLTMRLWNHPEGRSRYLSESQRLLDEVWDEDWLHEEINRMESLITPHLLDSQETSEWIDGVRKFVDLRREPIQKVIDSEPESPIFEHEKECLEPMGHLTASFSTEWDTMEVENVFEEFPSSMTGTVEVSWGQSQDLYSAYVGAQAGVDEDGAPMLVILGIDETFRHLTIAVLYFPGDINVGSYPVDVVALPGFVYAIDLARPNDPPEYFAYMGGEVSFTEFSYTSGGAISGELDVLLIPPFF